MGSRDLGLNLLRAIGLLSIILAHVNPPSLLFQLRTFDVIMMVCVSTISYTDYARPKPYKDYLIGRIKRLLFPTWEFILLMSIVLSVVCYIEGAFIPNTYKYPPRLQYILWGLIVISGSFCILRYIKVTKLPEIVTFISSNSLWMYFWHVIVLNLFTTYPNWFDSRLLDSWCVKWLFVVTFACIMCATQNKLLKFIKIAK